jgi:hypothetical protein
MMVALLGQPRHRPDNGAGALRKVSHLLRYVQCVAQHPGGQMGRQLVEHGDSIGYFLAFSRQDERLTHGLAPVRLRQAWCNLC